MAGEGRRLAMRCTGTPSSRGRLPGQPDGYNTIVARTPTKVNARAMIDCCNLAGIPDTSGLSTTSYVSASPAGLSQYSAFLASLFREKLARGVNAR